MNEYFILNLDYTFGMQTDTIHPILLRDENDLVLIDCGYPHFLPQIKTAAEAQGIDLDTLTKIIVTHHDYDHMGALAEIQAAYPKVEIYASKEQVPYIEGKKKSLRLIQAEEIYETLPDNEKESAMRLQELYASVQPAYVDVALEGDEVFPWCGGVQIIPTPGHMPGHISVYLPEFKVLLAGDALTITDGKLSVSDQYTLDIAQAKESARRLLCYDITKIICYHGGIWDKDIKKSINTTMSLSEIISVVREAETANVHYTQNVKIVYFSGTGGTALAAEAFKASFENAGKSVTMNPLDMQDANFEDAASVEGTELLVLMYPVYASDAPAPVFDWMEALPQGNGLSAAVISVSGGGEIWPNTASRITCIDYLEVKGYNVFYERMLVMPTNVFFADKQKTGARLLQVLPEKSEHCVNQILSGKRKRNTKKPFARKMLANMARQFRQNSFKFGKQLAPTKNCTGCGICADHCPQKNIKINFGRPIFSDKCVMCMRCIYGCPEYAIITKKYKSFPLKSGFDIEKIKEESKETLDPKKIKGGLLYGEVKKYIKNIYR